MTITVFGDRSVIYISLFQISDFSMPLIHKDYNNMETQIRRILYHEVSIAGNLSNVQTVLHDLHGI